MARTRNIKPGFFTNEELAACQPLARILFAALWCQADRAGRLEDRPKRIKAESLPYDDCDCDQLLDELARHGFIIRYQIGGRAYIQIPTFSEHQRPHKEKASEIPPPQCVTATPENPGQVQEKSGSNPDQFGNALRPFPPFLLSSFPPSTLSDGLEKGPGKEVTEPDHSPPFDFTLPGLATAWNFYHRGAARSQRDLESVQAALGEMIRHGIPPNVIDAEIRDPRRRRTETLWDLEKRLLAQRGLHESGRGVGQTSRVSAPAGKYDRIGETIRADAPAAESSERQATAARGPPRSVANH